MWIVKLGGSLLGSPALKAWLDTLTKFGDGKVVIVPGGGLFADAVREAQAKTRISDAVAHEMALLAMDQYATLMTGLNSDLVTASTELEIAERGWQHRAIVWKPSHMVLADELLPKNWDLTSDSIAAWLADKLNAQHLLVVKSAKIPDNTSIDYLVETKLVDACFPQYVVNKPFRTWLLAQRDFAAIRQAITHQATPPCGIEIL